MLSTFALLSFGLVALAQTPEPPAPPEPIHPPQGEQPRVIAERKEEGVPWQALQAIGSAKQRQPSSPAVSLGQPGLSFRYEQTFGITGEPYLADGQHLNSPNGLFFDITTNNLFVVEELGHRLLAFSSTGQNLYTMTIGHAGKPWHHDDYLSYPKDVAVDGDGNIWILLSPTLKEFDSSGNVIQRYPDTDPWVAGEENDRFDDPYGIEFDDSGRLFVSDTNNHRIQVYSFSAEGTPVYSTTIGVTGIEKTDNTGFSYPHQIAFDSIGRLYVVDANNYRIQRCVFSVSWTCSTIFGETGVAGNDLTHMEWSNGIFIDSSDNIFIADGLNHRVLKCNTSGSCTHLLGVTGVSGQDNSHFNFPADVSVDASGNVFVSDANNHRVQKYTNTSSYITKIGVTREPYIPSTTRMNSPWGVTLAQDGSIYITERRGFRLVKLNSTGTQQWTVGQAGVYSDDNSHFGSWWAGLEGNPAVDVSGNIYVPDTGNDRIQIFNSGGNYLDTFGSSGDGLYEFSCPTGVTMSPVNGDIYVVDHCNHRIQVFTSGRINKATLGITGESGDDNQHFNHPWGVAIDSSGNIYVADSDNYRIQKCSLNLGGYTCTTFVGETGVFGSDFGHMYPLAVAVDKGGRVYVADEWNDRVQVFDSTGAYLTTIGGSWGDHTGQMVAPSGIAIDNAGNVYVTDRENHRIQKFATGEPGWMQNNINGFGERWNVSILSLDSFNGKLYAGGVQWYGGGDRIWRKGENEPWTAVITDSFGLLYNPAIIDLIEFNNQLYAGTENWNWDIGDTEGGEIWRSSNGLDWTRVITQGFGDPTNIEITQFTVFSNTLYAGTYSYTTTHGAEIWRSSTGNSGEWERVVSNGLGDANNLGVLSYEVFNGYLYAGTYNRNENTGTSTGGEVWRTGNGMSWVQVNADGFNDTLNTAVISMAAFNGYLYAGTSNWDDGAEIWRCSNCAAAGDWTQVMGGGFNDLNNKGIDTLVVYNNELYAVTYNYEAGMEIWCSADGTNWEQVGFAGFGDSNNVRSFLTSSATVFNNRLYIGTWNEANGGEVWMYLHKKVYLPLVLR